MRKRITAPPQEAASPKDGDWLDIEKLAEVEITSEDAEHPIEFALLPGRDQGWKATQSGEQILRLIFDAPQKLTHIRLVFIENHHQRTQEFVLRWSKDAKTFTDIVRQQYNFNPPATETEDYNVNLSDVKILELKIVPDVNSGVAIAALSELRLA